MGRTLFLGSSLNDCLTAYDTETGAERWRYFSDGPIRFAPIAANGKVWFASDDGFLYCLSASDGKLLWRFRGGPASRKLLGNGRLISAWPARGGPVLVDGVVYFAAGIWPFMGVFVHALDAETGRVLWTNRDCNSLYRMVDHNLYDYIGLSPQGYLVAVGDKLIVPCGRSWPACLDRRTGKLVYFRQGQEMADTRGKEWSKRSYHGGSWQVVANSRYIFNTLSHGAGTLGGVLRLDDGGLVQLISRTNLLPELVLTDDALYGARGSVRAYKNGALVDRLATDVSGAGIVVEADGVSLPIERALFTSAGTKSRNHVHTKIPNLLAITKNYHQTLVKLDTSGLATKPEEVLAAMKVGWVRVPGKSAKVTFHRMLRDWSQHACWTRPFPDKEEVWNGLRPGKDYEADPFATVNSRRVAPGDVYESAGFGGAIANWQSREWPNHGFLVKIDGPAQQINMPMPEGARGRITKTTRTELPPLWEVTCKAETLIKAGSRLYVGAESELLAIDVPPGTGEPRISWKAQVDGTPRALAAAAGKLFAVTKEGRLHCFGAEKVQIRNYPRTPPAPAAQSDSSTRMAAEVLKATGVTDGYCVVLGASAVVEELLRQSKLYVIAVDEDRAKITRLRKRLVDAGLHGKRAACFGGSPADAGLPPYLASLIVAERFSPDWPSQTLLQSLRPYGGALVARVTGDRRKEVLDWAAKGNLANAKVESVGEFALISRAGALPGAGRWTHEYADTARSLASTDALAKPPFGVLWFGGPADGLFAKPFFIPRYYPAPHVVGGRLIAQAVDRMSAIDVYTGRKLWTARLPHPEEVYDVYHVRTPGYSSASTRDSIYIGCGETCLRLDTKTGRKLAEFRLPPVGRNGEAPYWGQVIVSDDLLIAGTVIPRRFWEPAYSLVKKGELTTDELLKLDTWANSMVKAGKIRPREGESRSATADRVVREILAGADIPSSFPKELRDAAAKQKAVRLERNDRVYVMDRFTGEVLWTRQAALGFTNIDNRLGNPRLGAVAVGNGTMFALDSLHRNTFEMLKRRGRATGQKPELLALGLRSGKVLWRVREGALHKFWVAYSAAKDVVLMGVAGDIAAFRGSNGEKLWATNTPGSTFNRPSIVRDDVVITMYLKGDLSGKSLDTRLNSMHREWVMQDLMTGKVTKRFMVPGAYCGFATSGPDFLMFRATSMAYYDFATNLVRNLSGLRTGCANGLIPADGVVSSPHLGWHCVCNYPIATSVTLIHTPEATKWANMPPQAPFVPPSTKRP